MDATRRELFAKELTEVILKNIYLFQDKAMQNTNTNATKIIEEIHKALENEQTDFEVIEEIVSIMERNGVYTNRHDF